MMILPIADALQNCLQNLTSRIAGIDNEQMTGRVIGIGAMLGASVGAISQQFKKPMANNSNNSNDNNSEGGFKGFISRAKSVINPRMNLSDESDYSGNVNPIRNVVPKEKIIQKENNNNNRNPMVGKVAKGTFNATKAYLGMGAKMVEGDFSKSKSYKNSRKSNYKNAEYISKTINKNMEEKIGDDNEHKE